MQVLEGPKPRKAAVPKLIGGDMEQPGLALVAVGKNGTATLEDILKVFYKTKHIFTI